MRSQSKAHSLDRKVAIVTGASSGLGEVTATELARRGMHVFLACRSRDKAAQVIAKIVAATGNLAVEFLPLELGELESVNACADMFLRRELPLHLLVNNAGLAGQHGKTESGFELAFGVNHVGTFLFTHRLLARLAASAPARVVTVASDSHYNATGIDFEAIRKRTPSLTATREYAVSKLANVLFSNELARRLEGTGVTTYAVHPGTVATNIWRGIPAPVSTLMKLFMIDAAQGARTILHCALAAELGTSSGEYYRDCHTQQPSDVALDVRLARELWQRSEGWTLELSSPRTTFTHLGRVLS